MNEELICNEIEDEIIGNNRSYYQQLLLQQLQAQNQNKQGPEQATEYQQREGQVIQQQTQQHQTYDPEVFIDEMQNFPSLWNTSTTSHHDQNARQNSWDQLSKTFGRPGKGLFSCSTMLLLYLLNQKSFVMKKRRLFV